MHENIVSIKEEQTLSDALLSLDKHNLHALAVVDADNRAIGSISTTIIVSHCLPNYILESDFVSVKGIPDLEAWLKTSCQTIQKKLVRDIYEQVPIVLHNASLTSVAADMIRYGKHESALVVNEQQHLLGVISARDVLCGLGMMTK
ncbi:MAG: CBS domain-containing protein [Mariprofundales bacterium]